MLPEQISEGSSYETTLADLVSKGVPPQTARIMAKAVAEAAVAEVAAEAAAEAAAEHGNEPIHSCCKLM
jgi:hypothetical protein